MKPQICDLGAIKNSVKPTKMGKLGILAEIASRTSATAVSENAPFCCSSIAIASNTCVREEKALKPSSTKGKAFENLWYFRWMTLKIPSQQLNVMWTKN